MSTLTERAKAVAFEKKMSLAKFQETLGLSIGHFYNCQNLTRKVARIIEERYPDIDTNWLATGEGSMYRNENNKGKKEDVAAFRVPILPIAAQGGTPNDFDSQVKQYDCEMVLSPVRDVNLAICINGDSMSPEYPNGSRVFVQKVNEQSFIEWGCTYVLDTVNGAIIKNVLPCTSDETKIICHSVNPNFADFQVAKSDIRAWYRVRCCITIK